MALRTSDQGLRRFKKSKIEVLLEIIEELSEVYGNEIPETLVIEKATERGVEDPEEKIRFMKKHFAIIYTSPTTFKKAWPAL